MTMGAMDRRGFPHSIFGVGATSKVAYTGTAGTLSAAVGTADVMGFYDIMCTTDAHIAFGTSPTADTDDMPVAAGERVRIARRGTFKVSAVRQAASGTLFVTALNDGNV